MLLSPRWCGAEPGRPEEQALAPAPTPSSLSSRHEAAQESFGGRLIKAKCTSCSGMAAKKLTCVSERNSPLMPMGVPLGRRFCLSSFEREDCTEFKGWRGSPLSPPFSFTQPASSCCKSSICGRALYVPARKNTTVWSYVWQG